MKIYVRPGELTATACRSARCSPCGAFVRRETQEFRQPVPQQMPLGMPPAQQWALALLLERVFAWKATPVPCTRCPERVIGAAP